MDSNRYKRPYEVEDSDSSDEEYQSPLKKQRMVLYLDDNTPIRTIKVTNIGDDMSPEYLRGHFEFVTGPVSDVSIVRQLKHNQFIRVAYVTFMIPEDAAKLICDPNSKSKFTIAQAESGRQPKIDPNAVQFEEFNNECLSRIASYLNLIDIVNLGKTSSRLRSFTEQIFREKTDFSYDDDSDDPSLNGKNLRTILKKMGPYIRSIYWRNLNETHLDLLSQYCRNVTKLKLVDPSKYLHIPVIQRNQSFFYGMNEVVIVRGKFFDGAMKIITSASNLERLRLIECPNIKGKIFNEWKSCQLVSLEISHCRHVQNILHYCGVRPIPTLTTLKVNEMVIDADVVGCLGSPNVRQLSLKNVSNTMGRRLYPFLQGILPNVINLTMQMENEAEKIDIKPVCEMVNSLHHLRFFSHSSMTWQLLNMIRQDRIRHKLPRINIGISKILFDDPIKADFIATCKQAVVLSLSD